MSKEAMKLSQDLRTLADRFSEGWHDGIKIDASDIILLTDAAEALAEQPSQRSVKPLTDEQRMIERVDAAMVATRDIVPRITRSQCETIIRAAALGIKE